MDLLKRSLLSIFSVNTANQTGPYVLEIVTALSDRLATSPRLQDRRDVCRALRALSKKHRFLVGAHSLSHLQTVLLDDASNEQIIIDVLDTLSNICHPEAFPEEAGQTHKNTGKVFTEMLTKDDDLTVGLLDLIAHPDYEVRRRSLHLLTQILRNQPRKVQEVILCCNQGVTRLLDVLKEESLSRPALVLLTHLTKGHADLQKIIAFEDTFDYALHLITTDPDHMAPDGLSLLLNLLRNNPSNLTFFCEGCYLLKLSKCYDVLHCRADWCNMQLLLAVVQSLVSPSNSRTIIAKCQSAIQKCGFFSKLCGLLMTCDLPTHLITVALLTVAEVIRGHEKNQFAFSYLDAPSDPPRKMLVVLLIAMISPKQPLLLRQAALYCFQNFVFQNLQNQHECISDLLDPDAGHIGPGHILCDGLSGHDKVGKWLCSVALMHCLMYQKVNKEHLLQVQMAVTKGTPVPLLRHCFNMLDQRSCGMELEMGVLMLLCTWVWDCAAAGHQLLLIPSVLPYLICQITCNDYEDLQPLGQGLCALLFGLCLVFNDDTVPGATSNQMILMVEKRIGMERFLSKLSEVSKHEAYHRAIKYFQPKADKAEHLVLDHEFCNHFQHLEQIVLQKMSHDLADDNLILNQYKELIRSQDKRICDVSRANDFLRQELQLVLAKFQEVQATVQELQDQNALLRAQCWKRLLDPDLNNNAQDERVHSLRKQIRDRDETISSLEHLLSEGCDPAAQQHLELLHRQVSSLQEAIKAKDEDIICLRLDILAFDDLQAEHRELQQVLLTNQIRILQLSDQVARLKP